MREIRGKQEKDNKEVKVMKAQCMMIYRCYYVNQG